VLEGKRLYVADWPRCGFQSYRLRIPTMLYDVGTAMEEFLAMWEGDGGNGGRHHPSCAWDPKQHRSFHNYSAVLVINYQRQLRVINGSWVLEVNSWVVILVVW
jgi:hypothetical protein